MYASQCSCLLSTGVHELITHHWWVLLLQGGLKLGDPAPTSEHCLRISCSLILSLALTVKRRAVQAGATTSDNPSHGSRVLVRVVSWLRESPVSPPHQQPATRLAANSPSSKARQVHIVNRVSQHQSRPPPCVRSSASTSARPVSRADRWSVQTVLMFKSSASGLWRAQWFHPHTSCGPNSLRVQCQSSTPDSSGGSQPPIAREATSCASAVSD